MHVKTLVLGSLFLMCALISSFPSPAGVLLQEDLSSRLPDGEGKGYVQTLCTNCHGLGNIVDQRKSAEEWEATVSTMLERLSPTGMDREAGIISKYLAANFSTPPAGAAVKPESGRTAGGGAAAIRVSHEVLFDFKPDVPEEKRKAVLESGKKVFESIPQVVSVVVGRVMQKDAELPYGLFIGLRSEEDLQTYRNSPAHQKWSEEAFRPVITRSVVSDTVASAE